MNKKMAIVILLGMLSALAASQNAEELAPESWYHEGDTDGDGLRDAFEISQGLDPNHAVSFADGIADEDRAHPSGGTMFDAQSSGQTPGGDSEGGSSCGATGMEPLLVGLLLLERRRKLV